MELARQKWSRIVHGKIEQSSREIKKSVRHLMQNNKVPNGLWDFCAVDVCELRCLTVHGHFSIHGQTPYEMTTGQTPDISEYTEFGFYELIWYCDEMAVFVWKINTVLLTGGLRKIRK